MNRMKQFLFEDIDAYTYFMEEEQRATYQKKKYIYGCIPLLLVPVFLIKQEWQNLLLVPLLMLLFYKLPFLMLQMKHTQNCNDVVCAIPLWVNQLYALIEKNTIHNAIVNSYSDHTPKVIKQDLKALIEKIEQQPNHREAYVSFLSKYKIDGMADIMLKLFEYRNLSKEKLKYEIHNLNQSLGKIETMKRQSQFKREVFVGDTCTCFIIFVPCLYMTVISLMPSLFTV